MKILLLNPPARQKDYSSILAPPLGILYIGTVLKKAGFDVIIKDAFAENITWNQYYDYIKTTKPEILGLSSMTPTIDTAFKAIKIARPYVRYIIIGGPHASLFRQKIFKQCPEIDFAVIGEGEQTILELIRYIEIKNDINNIDGVITKNIKNKDRKFIDINSLPVPDRSLLNNNLYRYPLLKYKNMTTIFTSRGCPYNCSFCDKSTFGSIWRARSSESVLSEIDEIVNIYGIKSIIFYDDLFTVDKKRVTEICEAILKRRYKLDWKCEGRVNLVDFEILNLMKQAGCSMIAYGVESANQHGLDYLNKKTSVKQIIKAFDLTHKARLKTMAYFIFGIPVETYKDELKTIELAKKIKTDYAQFSVLSPYYGTKVYNDAISCGWYKEVDAKNPLDKDLKRPVILSKNWNEEKLQNILKIAYKTFYLRFSYIIKHLFSFKSIYQLKSYLKEFSNIILWSSIKKNK